MKLTNYLISLLFIILFFGCSKVEIVSQKEKLGDFDEKIVENIGEEESVSKIKIATILPLSGKNQKIGKEILNAINLSLFDNDTRSKIELVIYDNKSSQYQGKKIIKEIAKSGIKLVLGPIFTNSVESIITEAKDNDITVISFSNNTELAKNDNIFLAGFLLQQEIDHLTSYLIDNNKNNFSVISRNNQYGLEVVRTLREIVEMKDANFISSQFYIGNKENFDDIANKTLTFYKVSDEIQDYQEELEEIEDKEERKLREIEIINNYKIYSDVILIADSSNNAPQIINSIKSSNIDGRDIQIIGTRQWNKDSIIQNQDISNVLIADSNDEYFNKFKKKYLEIYNEEPARISSIGYDMIAFISDLIKDIDGYPSSQDIVNYNSKRGFRGIDGLFRFLPNGLIQRNLAILKINNGKIEVVKSDSKRFLNY